MEDTQNKEHSGQRRVTDSATNMIADPQGSNLPFPGLEKSWVPPANTVTITKEIEARPDFEVKIWNASNGYTLEIKKIKYVAKNAEEMAEIFLEVFSKTRLR